MQRRHVDADDATGPTDADGPTNPKPSAARCCGSGVMRGWWTRDSRVAEDEVS
jgi:hypothetical protein